MEAAQAASRDIPIQIRSLLCDRCWNGPFSFSNFQKALTSSEESVDRSRGYTYTTPSWKEIDEGENKGCNFCDFLWGDILEYRKSRRDQHLRTEEWPDDDETWRVTLRFGKRKEYPHHTFMSTYIGEDMFPNTYEVHTTADDNAASFVSGRNVVWKVSSPECFKFASDDLKDCIVNHDCPKPQPTHLPTRVVDCSNPARPKLFIPPNDLQDAYVTLSYVWGQAQPHSTCTTNIDIYINEGIDASLLPQTIKDAIKCTNAIGLRYLWVDTLCIIQDSAEDKNHEISRMCDIYNGAYVTILAACAQKAGDGFLHDRKNPETMDLPFWCPDGRIGRVSVRDQVRAPRDDPVTRRAWCFQEQLLSPRLLIYASHTLQYECQAGIKNVGNANNFLVDEEKEKLRLPTRRMNSLQDSSPKEIRQMWRLWKTILADYSQRSLTSPADKLVALSGVAQYFSRSWGGGMESEYTAGLWKHSLTQDILWYRSSSRSLMPRPDTYRAPSWSWAASDGAIDSGIAWPGWVEPTWFILRCDIVPRIGDLTFGEIKGAELEVEAILKQVGWETEEDDSYVLDSGPSQRRIGYIYWDTTEEFNESRGQAVVVGSFGNQDLRHLIGLLVVPVQRDGVDSGRLLHYRRVGLFSVHEEIQDEGWKDEPFCDVKCWLETPRKALVLE